MAMHRKIKLLGSSGCWKTGIVVNSRNLTPPLRKLTSEFREIEATLPLPTVIASMGDFDPGPRPSHFSRRLGSKSRPLGAPATSSP